MIFVISDGNTHSFLNAIKKSEPLEYKKVVDQNLNENCSSEEMMEFCKRKLKDELSFISRDLIHLGNSSESEGIRLMQWNILSEGNDPLIKIVTKH